MERVIVNDGGPAFPRSPFVHPHTDAFNWPEDYGCGGISTRDYFASMAMQAIVGNVQNEKVENIGKKEVAHLAYQIADAMLKAREAK